MTTAAPGAPTASPWLTIWLRPGETIDRLRATDPRRHVFLLAILTAVGSNFNSAIDAGLSGVMRDWRLLAALALVAIPVGMIGLYVQALVLRWLGRRFGGQARLVEVRAAVAWGMAPGIVGLAVTIIALLAPKLAGGVPAKMLIAASIVIVVVFGLWSLILTIRLFGRVERFGWGRAMAGVVLASATMWLLFATPLILVRSFVLQPFSIPAGSMKPALQAGDYLWAAKFSYGYSRYSLPFSPPLFDGRVLAAEPKLGDIVVFRLPKDDSVDYVKRVVGLPGDRIQMIDGALHINGVAVKRERLDDLVEADAAGREQRGKRWRETLPNGVSYVTLDLVDNGFYDDTPVYSVPPGHYFMLGDNRDNSTDSRVLSQVGYVPFDHLVGKAKVLYFSVEREATPGQEWIRWERVGMAVE